MPERYLLTGFGPFGNDTINPAALIAEAWGGLPLPVAAATAWELTRAEMTKRNATGVIALGVAGGRPHFSVERQAINQNDYPLADDEGCCLNGPIFPELPTSAPLVTALPCAPLARAVRACRGADRSRLRARISRDAGRYVCNHFYALMLRHLNGHALFLHLPRVPEVARLAPNGGPSWPLEDSRRAVRAVLRELEKTGMILV